jgi:DNA polymerase-3 subunit gamma/tau
MSYISLARKYRPQTFDDIVGQDHVATTLKNAISMDMAAHAYLFAGPRGVGKTSTARILAKSLNCEKGPTVTACGTCLSCQEITRGVSMDVIEIDGASNRGIDEIRNLKENVKYAPARGAFRIYIIDEVHMLTQEAFNALLKTLEEPPPHVKFIFATTRPYKVLATIISRCQRFDFKKIPSHDIVKRLTEIRTAEKFDIGDDALFLVAKASDGSLRDAQVVLDQLLSFAKGKITARDITTVLGFLEQDVLFDIAACMVTGDKRQILVLLNDLVNSGKDPVFIATNLIDHFRNLMVARIVKERSGLLSTISEDHYHRLQEQGQRFSLDEILYITYTLSATIDLIRKTSLAKIPLEIAMIKLTDRNRLMSLKDALERLSAIEKRLKQGEGIAPATGTRAVSRVIEDGPGPEEISQTGQAPAAIPNRPATAEVEAEKDILLFQKIKSSWMKVLGFIKSRRMSIATFLAEGQLLKVKDSALFVGFEKRNSLHRDTLEANSNKNFIEEAIRSVIGEHVSFCVESVESAVEPETKLSDIETEAELPGPRQSKKIDPIVESALDIFDGKIVEVRENNPNK